MTPRDEADAQARARFRALNLVRFAGVALMLIGMAVIATGWIEPREVAGLALFAVGFVDALIVPQILARRWRTPPRS